MYGQNIFEFYNIFKECHNKTIRIRMIQDTKTIIRVSDVVYGPFDCFFFRPN